MIEGSMFFVVFFSCFLTLMFMVLHDFLRLSLAFFAGVFALGSAPFVVAHVMDSWDAPEYPFSGFCPDAPGCEADVLDSLPQTVAARKGGAL
ncbi:MAG: hypothetical protein ACI4O9_03400 [Akkermansia sp.]